MTHQAPTQEINNRSVAPVRSIIRRFARATAAQTMLEYAVLTGFGAVLLGASLMTAPTVTDSMKTLLNKAGKLLALAAGLAAQNAC
jgi:Flp pilus assembly pilin Flp